MPNAAIQLNDIPEDRVITARSSGREIPEDVPELEARGQLHVLQNSTQGLRTADEPEIARRSAAPDLAGDRQTVEHRLVPQTPGHDRLLNARQVAEKLGVSERFIRDHTTRRSPRIPAVKLGKLIRYRLTDVEVFMAELGTLTSSRGSRFGV